MQPANDTTASDRGALTAERRARMATDHAYSAARAAYASRAKADILKAGDLHRHAGALYQQAADAWKARGADRKPFAEHCAKMADRLSISPFARASLAATYQHVE